MAFITITDLSGGRNGVDSPISDQFPMNQVVDAVNIDYTHGGLGEKRLGSYEVLANFTGGTAFASEIKSLNRFDIGTGNEIWATDGKATPLTKRSVAGTTLWADVTFNDAISSAANAKNLQGTSFNGKFFLSYQSSVDRLHCYDPGTATTRRVGIGTPAAPGAVTNTGAGAYAATLRYYRIRYALLSGTTIVKRSEPSTSVSFTPSGAGTAARVPKGANPGEDETHWYVEASTDNVFFFEISSSIAIATTTYDDSAAVATYANSALSEPLGYFTVPPDLLTTITDGNRIVGVQRASSRIYWTPVLGSLNRGDDERVVSTATQVPYLDLNPSDGGNLTALARTVNGVLYAFKANQVWRLTVTGDAIKPYVARKISDTTGAINHKCVTVGEDATGNPVVYFLHQRGVYSVGAEGIHYCHRDMEDLTRDADKGFQPNIDTTLSTIICHILYAKDLAQLFVWFPIVVGSDTIQCHVLNVKYATRRDQYGVRGGWALYTQAPTLAICSAEFTNLGGLGYRPWIGTTAGGPTQLFNLLNANQTGAKSQDDSVNYRAYFKTRHPVKPTLEKRIGVTESIITGKTFIGAATLTQTIDRDQGAESLASTTVLDSTRFWKFEGSTEADGGVLQFTIGEATTQNTRWKLDSLTLHLHDEGER